MHCHPLGLHSPVRSARHTVASSPIILHHHGTSGVSGRHPTVASCQLPAANYYHGLIYQNFSSPATSELPPPDGAPRKNGAVATEMEGLLSSCCRRSPAAFPGRRSSQKLTSALVCQRPAPMYGTPSCEVSAKKYPMGNPGRAVESAAERAIAGRIRPCYTKPKNHFFLVLFGWIFLLARCVACGPSRHLAMGGVECLSIACPVPFSSIGGSIPAWGTFFWVLKTKL